MSESLSCQLTESMFHRFREPIVGILLPKKFTYPFCYTPHPLCVKAAEEVCGYLSNRTEWREELAQGKMFGVLVVQTAEGETGYLAAFSGLLAGKNVHPFFVPPVYDLQQPDGFFKAEETEISRLNHRIRTLEAEPAFRKMEAELTKLRMEADSCLKEHREFMREAKSKRDALRKQGGLTREEEAVLIRESQYQKAEHKRMERAWQERIDNLVRSLARWETEIMHLKAERKQRSAALQQRLFRSFRVLNARGDISDLSEIFSHTSHRIPPAGAGECAAPKLLQQAYLHGWKPLCMAEFWWGTSPRAEIRRHGHYYPACKDKCEPILNHMLMGLEVDDNPMSARQRAGAGQVPAVIYEDRWLIVVDKPAGLLSVPGKIEEAPSVYAFLREHCPEADGPIMVHRLDMATSGLLVAAKSKPVHQNLQAQFKNRTVRKQYIALLEDMPVEADGIINLPLSPDLSDRPRQKVDAVHGKPAITRYVVLGKEASGYTRVAFYPQTGRTHQLRVHAAHPAGLHCPIVGDELYGHAAERLFLHAESLEFVHPVTGERMAFKREAGF